jgi:hypothetical protein
MTTNSTPKTKQEMFTHSAQLALQRLAQAQLALAFLGNDDRASRVSAQLNGVTELLGAMQADQAALLLEQAGTAGPDRRGIHTRVWPRPGDRADR